MNHIDRSRSVLVLVDFQKRLMPTIHDGAAVVQEATFLAKMARLLGVRVIGTEQNPAGLGENLPAIRELCDETLAKMHFDACRDGLLDAVQRTVRDAPARPVGAPDIVIAGCEAHVCLLQTALGLRRAGHEVFVVAPACGSRLPADHALAMRRLEHAGAVPVGAESVAFEWLGTCEHDAFKAALGLLKRRAATQSAA